MALNVEVFLDRTFKCKIIYFLDRSNFIFLKEGQACFPLGEFVHANREKSNLIGWRQTLTTSPPNPFLLVRAKKIAKWKTGFNVI